MSTPMVMPESGQDDEPTSPVMREETTENRKPSTRISSAPARFMWKAGTAQMTPTSSSEPAASSHTGVSRSVRSVPAPPAAPPKSELADARMDETMDGSARSSAKMPPMATAPAPMCLT